LTSPQVSSRSSARLAFHECILDPFDLGFVETIEQHGVKATIAFWLAGQIMARGENNATLLGGCNAGSRTTKAPVTAQPDLDEDQTATILANQIDLAAAYPPIALQHAQAVPPQKFCGKRFGSSARIRSKRFLYLHGAAARWTMGADG